VSLSEAPDRFTDLRQQAEREFPEAWIPKEGPPTIVGQFRRLEEATTQFGTSKIVILETEDGVERAVWLFHSVLRQEFARAKPKPGELVAVHHQGRKVSGSGQSYESYRVLVQRDEAQADWDSLGRESGDPAFDEDAAF
jgi:hypothetical protein